MDEWIEKVMHVCVYVKREILCDFAYWQNLKKQTKKQTNKKKPKKENCLNLLNSQIQRTDWWLTDAGGGQNG